MKLNPISKNCNEVEVNELTILFSYQTPVAVLCFVPTVGSVVFITDKGWSDTTARHISGFVGRFKSKRTVTVPQDLIEKAADGQIKILQTFLEPNQQEYAL